jgi:LmbE family N-acetylglucosaminyl deacetylase
VVAGIKHLWFLDYRDSGMKGTPGNDDPSCFHRCDEDEALARLVRIVREFKPTIMVTFDPTGGYGHPDHLMIHKLATLAFDAAADPGRYPEGGEPWQTARLYYSAFPRSLGARFMEFMRELGMDWGLGDFSFEEMGLPDEQITNVVDVREWVPLKERSLQSHRTQMDPNSPFSKLPPDILEIMRAREYYMLAAGVPLPDEPGAEGDLLAGLR